MDLCTIDDIKKEGNLSDEFIEEHESLIGVKIADISAKLLKIRPSLTRDNITARKCVVYGVLAWLQLRGYLAPSQESPGHIGGGEVKSIREGDITVTYASPAEVGLRQSRQTEYDYCSMYKRLLARIIGIRAFTAGTTWTTAKGKKKRTGLNWAEFFTEYTK